MADTTTSIFSFIKPEPGSSGWDVKINANYDLIDAAIAALPVLLETQKYTAGQATIDFDTNFDATYDHYFIEFSKVWVSVAGADLQVNIFANGAWKNQSSDYFIGLFDEVGTEIINGFSPSIILGKNMDAESYFDGGGGGRGRVDIYMYDAAVNTAPAVDCYLKTGVVGAFVKIFSCVSIYRGSVHALSGLRFFASTGNIEGEFKLFGVPK